MYTKSNLQVGLINNAGLPGFSEPVELLSMDQLRGVFEVPGVRIRITDPTRPKSNPFFRRHA